MNEVAELIVVGPNPYQSIILGLFERPNTIIDVDGLQIRFRYTIRKQNASLLRRDCPESGSNQKVKKCDATIPPWTAVVSADSPQFRGHIVSEAMKLK